jgi:hypothetical protein
VEPPATELYLVTFPLTTAADEPAKITEFIAWAGVELNPMPATDNIRVNRIGKIYLLITIIEFPH